MPRHKQMACARARLGAARQPAGTQARAHPDDLDEGEPKVLRTPGGEAGSWRRHQRAAARAPRGRPASGAPLRGPGPSGGAALRPCAPLPGERGCARCAWPAPAGAACRSAAGGSEPPAQAAPPAGQLAGHGRACTHQGWSSTHAEALAGRLGGGGLRMLLLLLCEAGHCRGGRAGSQRLLPRLLPLVVAGDGCACLLIVYTTTMVCLSPDLSSLCVSAQSVRQASGACWPCSAFQRSGARTDSHANSTPRCPAEAAQARSGGRA